MCPRARWHPTWPVNENGRNEEGNYHALTEPPNARLETIALLFSIKTALTTLQHLNSFSALFFTPWSILNFVLSLVLKCQKVQADGIQVLTKSVESNQPYTYWLLVSYVQTGHLVNQKQCSVFYKCLTDNCNETEKCRWDWAKQILWKRAARWLLFDWISALVS